MTKELEILNCWHEIKKLTMKIEDHQLAIGKLKDQILEVEQKIIHLQGDS